MRKGIIISGVVVAVMGIIFVILGLCFCAGDFLSLVEESFDNLTYEKTTTEVAEVKEVELDIELGYLVIQKGDKLKIEYIENDRTENKIDVTNGKLQFIQNRKHFINWGFWGINFRSSKYKIIVTIPNDNIPLTINLNNGILEIQDQEFKNLNVKNDNGKIILKNTKFEDANIIIDNASVNITNCNFSTLDLKNNNGSIKINGATAKNTKIDVDNGKVELFDVNSENINTRINNGEIELKNTISENYALKVDNGKICGTIKGKESEYTIYEKHDLGDSNLSDKTGTTDKKIDVAINNGSIDIRFVD